MDLKAFLGSKYDSDTFESFIRERFYGLEIYDSDYTDDFLSESEKKSIDTYRFLGKSELDDGKEIGFFEFKSKSTHIENKRVGYNAILKKLAYDEYLDGAIASFYHPDGTVWRLSFVGFEYDEGKASVTNLKRFTYVLGEGIPTKTPLAQLKNLKYPNLNEIEEAFSVEAVTDDFYKSYKALFEDINEELEPQKALFAGKEDPEVEIRKFSRKLLGRITFIYFLQKKGWLGVTDYWGDGDRNFLQNIFTQSKGNFYDERLRPLFFTALNSMREDDYFELLNCKIPFLNGGLFTKESYDREEINLSNELFEKIFDTFNQYNFTIIEDLPHDSEVAIDPEMLGRVFENLIEENYRKGKGAFYTPREIVHYMCKQSIIIYLSNHFDKEHMESLVNDAVTDDSYIKKHATDINNKLLQMKVLDPAIGSGAFPMGVLHEMVQIIGNLNKTDNPSKEKKLIIENSIYGVDIDGSAVDIAKLRFWLSIIVDEEEPFPLPNLAFKIMQGNSLIETIDGFSPIPEDIYEQKERKPVSLFEDEEQSLFDETKFDQLRDNIHAFYNASDTDKKKSLENKIKAQIQEIVCGYIDIKEDKLKARTKDFDNTTKSSSREKLWNEMDRLQKSIIKARKIIGDILTNNFQTTELFLYKLWFGEIIKDGGFDVIIGNPPYVGEKGNKEIFAPLKHLKYYQGKMDLFYFFFHVSLDHLKHGGILSFITTNYYITATGAVTLRNDFKERTTLLNLINFNELKIFASALGQHNMITTIQKGRFDKLAKTSIVNAKGYFGNEILQSIVDGKNNETDYYQIPQDKLYSDGNIKLTIGGLDDTLDRILSESESLGNILNVRQGLRTGADSVTKKHLIDYEFNGEIGDGIFVINKKNNVDLMIENTILKKWYKNSNIEKYFLDNTINEYVIFSEKNNDEATFRNQFPNAYKHLLKYKTLLEKIRLRNNERVDYWYTLDRTRDSEMFEVEKIVAPQRSFRNTFAYSKQALHASADVYFMSKPKNNYCLKFILAILNSKLIYVWLYYRGKRKGEMLELYQQPLSKIPIIKNVNPKVQNIFEYGVDCIMWLKSNDKGIDNYVDNEHIAKLFEDVIDAMVLELYFENEMKEAGFDFVNHAKELFKPIENLSDSATKDIINNAYQSLREKDNPIRNDLQLLPIRVPMVAPILESI